MRASTLFVVLPLILGVVARVDAQDSSGCWAGSIGPVRVAFELSLVAGAWSGTIHRFAGTVISDPLTNVTIDGDRVRFALPAGEGAGPAEFSGTIEGNEIVGATTVQGSESPAAVRRVDAATHEPGLELIGYWSGGIEQGGAVVLRLGVEVAPAPCGQVIVTMDSPDQGVEGIPVSSLEVRGDSLIFTVAAVGGAFRGIVDVGRTRAEGLWTQGPASTGMSLTRGDGAVSFMRPQEPTPPFPYLSEEVRYENLDDGITLAGTLTLPEGEGPFPAALLLTGSGAQDRDETIMGHKPFLVIADYLTRRGIAVLRVDDRGVGGSTGNVFDATIADNVRDAIAGVRFLAADQRIDMERIGLIGHSEGGWVAPAAVAVTDDIAFVVMLAGPAVSPYALLESQARAILEASGETFVDERVALNREMLDVIRTESDDDAAVASMLRLLDDWLASLPAGEGAAIRDAMSDAAYRAQLEQSLRSQTTPWFRGLLEYEPGPSLEALDVPVAALFGELDLQVPPAPSVAHLTTIWADHPDATIHIFPGLNHLFQHAETGLMAEYSQIDETFAPVALEAIAAWIEERFVR